MSLVKLIKYRCHFESKMCFLLKILQKRDKNMIFGPRIIFLSRFWLFELNIQLISSKFCFFSMYMESPQTFDKIIQFLKGNRAMAIQNHGFASTKQHGLKPVDIRFLTMYIEL